MEQKLQLPTELPEDHSPTAETGLTEEEAAKRLAAGQGNAMKQETGKTVPEIIFGNLFSFFNLLNFGLAFCLLLVGSYRNMMFLLIVAANTLIGTVQELRARATIRKLKLLNAPKTRVIRGGQEKETAPEELVRGDLMILRAGDQVTADALVTAGEGSAMESLLTGESNAVGKKPGSWLYSGSYITEGTVTAQAVYMGDESYVGRLNAEAKKTVRPKSVLMTELNRLIRWDSMVLIPLGILLFLKQVYMQGHTTETAVPSTVAAMLGMIPEGLILLTSIAMAVGVMRLGKRNTLVQELSAIESLARVDTLCLDKTGTLTDGKIILESIEPVDATEEEALRALSRFTGAIDDRSATMSALRAKAAPGTEKAAAVLPFSSERKKSAVAFADGSCLILGAPEFVMGNAYPEKLRDRVNALALEGRRVVLLASARGDITDGEPPAPERILCLGVLRDGMREGVEETLRYFREQDVKLKVISGDNPRTVSMIAKRAGMPEWDNWVDARELNTEEKLLEGCEKYDIFGRVTPEQKKLLVLALKKAGHTVAMTGDGVNDIPAMKAADCSIAMGEGSDAARNSAQLTLLDSSFGEMPQIVLEGRRVVNNITRSATLFLTKTVFSFLLAFAFLFLPGLYPFQPIQMSLVSSATVGIPGFLLALEFSRERIRGRFLRNIFTRALPGGIAVAVCAALAMQLASRGWTLAECSTAATWLAGAMSWLVLARVSWPLNRLRGATVALSAAVLAAVGLYFGHVFYLVPMDAEHWKYTALLGLLGAGVMYLTARLIRERQRRKEEEKEL